MKHLRKLLIVLFIAQFLFEGTKSYAQERNSGFNILTLCDSVFLVNVPKLILPPEYRYKDLPYKLDNSTLPFLRPVFEQSNASCGQAASIGYNFTYEIDRARILPADLPQNQYPTHFTWNFMNTEGSTVGVGVSYFHSYEIVRVNGCPNVVDYGGMWDGRGDSLRWMSGYEKYYNAMHNRIEGLYQIDVRNPEGLLILKNWLHDHLDRSPFGGTANFYAGIIYPYLLPQGTPEAGKNVIKSWYPVATHAMTIVGYNDSIRSDYNTDGRYTNDVDINNDGVIDMKDWEIGGLKFVNSYGVSWGDSGFCYMMYKTLADMYGAGGIWNNSVNVIKVKPDYEPLLTMKVTLRHTCRNTIKVIAGISSDTSATFPVNEMEFPIFNYQGGEFYMQGGQSEEDKSIEFGLDITPLLTYMNNGEAAKIFLQINENDPTNKGTGEIVEWSVIDYVNGIHETMCQFVNVPINENNFTRLSVIKTVTFDKIRITGDSLPSIVTGEAYTHQFSATGGTPPYSWKLKADYAFNRVDEYFPLVDQEHLIPTNNQDGFVTKKLGFSFPFYNDTYDSVTLHTGGFLMFDQQTYPTPYIQDLNLLCRSTRSVSPLMNWSLIIISQNGDGIWYEGDEQQATFRWQVTDEYHPLNTSINFAVTLFADGKITFLYGDIISAESFTWMAGISDGDMQNFSFTGNSTEMDLSALQAVSFIRPDFLEGLSFSEDGMLSGTPSYTQKISEFQIIATDQNHISDIRHFQLSSGLYINHSVSAGDDSIINQNEQVILDLTIQYTGNDTLHNASLLFSIADKNITLLDSMKYIGVLSPDETLYLADAVRFLTGSDIPDLYTIQSSINFLSDEQNWQKSLNLQACAPLVVLGDMVVEDQEDHALEPGENAELNIKINNFGHSVAHGVSCNLSCQDPYISFNENLCLDYGDIQSRVNTSREINVTANPHTPPGHIIRIYFEIYDTTGFILTDSIRLLINPTKILIVDLDPNSSSGPVILNALAENMIVADYRDYIPWWDLYKYDAIFLCLGIFPGNYILETPDADYFVTYLNQGGHLYLEGGATWYHDDPTALQPMFHITGDQAAWTHKPDTLTGQLTTLTLGMTFDYTGENIRIDNLEGIEPARCIFRDKNNGFGFAVSYEEEAYKTIGTSFEFGGLTDSVYPSTKAELIRRYLEFFDFNTSDIAANFIADTLTLLTGTRIQFHDFSTDDVQSWSWTFPGGTPEVSSEREPVISYSMAGIFDVTLSVSNGNQSDMLTKNHYITVVSGQGAQEDDDPFEMSIYPNPSNGYFTLIMNSKDRTNLSMKIFNNTGQVVFEKVSSMIPGRYRETIDLMEQPAGIYFILLQDDSPQSVSKMILLK